MRERMAAELNMKLLVHRNPTAMALGINPFDHGSQVHTDLRKTQGLKQALDLHGFDAAFGGARRDEEKSRARERPVVDRDGVLIMVDDERMPLRPGEAPQLRKVRFRTLGSYPLSGAIESEAQTLPANIQELLLTRTSKRQGRMIDHDQSASMEKRKQEGYF